MKKITSLILLIALSIPAYAGITPGVVDLTARAALSGSANDSTARTNAATADSKAVAAQTTANSALSGSANDSTARAKVANGSGYVKVGTNYIQWIAAGGSMGTNTQITVTFPLAFPNAALSVVCTSSRLLATNDGSVFSASSLTASNFVLRYYSTNATPNGAAYCQAVGY